LFIPRLFELASHSEVLVQRDVIWTLSNIAADSPDHGMLILSNPVYMETLKNALFNGEKKE